MGVMRLFGVLATTLVAAFSIAGTLTVTSPTSGASLGADDSPYLGQTNTLRFNITDASVEVTVKAQVIGPSSTTSVEDKFQPNLDGRVSGSIPLNFAESAEEGNYTIVVTATEPGNTYAPTTLYVKVDSHKPKILEYSPLRNSFTRGIVPIRATVQESNVRQWTVTASSQVIQTGTTNDISADWDTAGIVNDGSQTILIKIEDKAGNETTQTINVTLDRVPPLVTIQFPRSDTAIRPGSPVSVIVDIRDATSTSVDVQGVDVIITRMDGTYIGRVSRISYSAAGGNGARWTGRIRFVNGKLPREFKVVVTAVDRAGNVATPQSVKVTVR